MVKLTKRQKEQKARQLPDYIPTTEEFGWYRYCMQNDIKISVGGTHQPGKWKIAIHHGGKWVDSPYTYDRNTIWQSYYEYCKFYYDKKK